MAATTGGGSVPEVVGKGIGMSYPIRKVNKERATPCPQKGGYTDGERVPQGTRIDHVRPRVTLGGTKQPTLS